jgi:hypothetical protein
MAQKYFGTNIAVANGFDLGAHKPLDSRTVVATYDDLATIDAIRLYKGLSVFVEEKSQYYVLVNHDENYSNCEWKLLGADDTLVQDVTDLKASVEAIPAELKDINDTIDAIKAREYVARVYDSRMGSDSSLADTEGKVDLSYYATIDDIKLKANVADVYKKTEVDGLLDNVVNQIPAAPFQSVAEGDKVLTLADGVLSSTLSYAREEVEGVDSLVLKGIDGVVIGSVPVADFIADGMLESVTPEEGTNNFIFTFKTGNDTTESFKVDFGKYVDTYNADGTTIELADKTFSVKDGVFAPFSLKKTVEDYINSNNQSVSDKVDARVYQEKVNEIDDAIKGLGENKVDKINGSSLVEDTLIAKLSGLANITGTGDNLNVENGVLTVDLSAYAKSEDVVAKETGKELIASDLIAKLEGIEAGAEVNYINSVGQYLNVAAGNLTVDLSSKLNRTATINGVGFGSDDSLELTGLNVALGGAITRTGTEGYAENVYLEDASIKAVLADLSHRIDVLDPNVSGELGITSIVEGTGIAVSVSGGQATVGVKVSTVEGNSLSVKNDGLYVAVPEIPDMRSYWTTLE